MGKQTIRIHRVGSVTFGAVLVVCGVIFLLRLFWQGMQYAFIFRLWPVVLIALGVEVLLGSRHKSYEVLDEKGQVVEQSKMVYDVPAIILTFAVTGFSFCMALVDWVCANYSTYTTF